MYDPLAECRARQPIPRSHLSFLNPSLKPLCCPCHLRNLSFRCFIKPAGLSKYTNVLSFENVILFLPSIKWAVTQSLTAWHIHKIKRYCFKFTNLICFFLYEVSANNITAPTERCRLLNSRFLFSHPFQFRLLCHNDRNKPRENQASKEKSHNYVFFFTLNRLPAEAKKYIPHLWMNDGILQTDIISLRPSALPFSRCTLPVTLTPIPLLWFMTPFACFWKGRTKSLIHVMTFSQLTC